jgi:NAD(P)-dependent dehydrogenase (short-subunit alcohol dehydrogenase family)
VSGPRMAAEGWYSVSRRQLLADRRLAVFLTGGGSGIGAAIFGELATTVGCVSCHRTVAFKAEHVAPIAMDVPDHAAGRRAFTSFAEFVWPAGLVNNAGAHHSKPNIELDLADVRDSLEPNRTEPNRTEPNRIAVVRLAQLARETGPNSPNSSAHKDDSIHAKVSRSIPVRKDRHRGKRSAAWLAACPKSGMRILGGSINNY